MCLKMCSMVFKIFINKLNLYTLIYKYLYVNESNLYLYGHKYFIFFYFVDHFTMKSSASH